jgi:hypothetical protein
MLHISNNSPERTQHNQPVVQWLCEYDHKRHYGKLAIEIFAIAWQVGGLAFLWAVASPQSKTENEKKSWT